MTLEMTLKTKENREELKIKTQMKKTLTSTWICSKKDEQIISVKQ